jgi:hypothetical protein
MPVMKADFMRAYPLVAKKNGAAADNRQANGRAAAGANSVSSGLLIEAAAAGSKPVRGGDPPVSPPARLPVCLPARLPVGQSACPAVRLLPARPAGRRAIRRRQTRPKEAAPQAAR